MGSWSYISQGKEFVSDATDLQANSPARSKNVLMGWELKTPCSYGNGILVSSQQMIQNQGFGEFGTPEMVRKQLPDNSIGDVSCSRDVDGIMVNSIMVSPNRFPRDDESSSKLSSSVMESTDSRDSLLIDLQLGRFADQSDPQNCKPSKANPILPSAESSTPAKRVRAVGLNSQTAFCQVHGCNKDLSSSKDYHKRHKVCEVHSKTAKVIVNGIEQRFCQQCSRFHLLAEFDDGKRSCRKRLAGHNERRRKPQVGIHPGRAGRLLQSYNGNRFQGTTLTTASFICQDILPSGLLQPEKYGVSDWCRRIKVEDATDYIPQSTIPTTNGHPHPKSLFPPYEFEKQYSPFPDNGAATGSIFSESNSRYLHDLEDANSGPHSFFQETSVGNEDLSVFDVGSTVQGLPGISNSGRALSLLSSQSQNSSSHSSGIPMVHPLIMPGCQAHYSIAQVPEKILGVSPQASMSGLSNKFLLSGMNSAEGNHLGPILISDCSEPVNYEVTDAIFQGSDFVNTKDCLPCETGPTIDLLQLSSQLHRVEHQRQSIHVKQENDTFCLRITDHNCCQAEDITLNPPPPQLCYHSPNATANPRHHLHHQKSSSSLTFSANMQTTALVTVFNEPGERYQGMGIYLGDGCRLYLEVSMN